MTDISKDLAALRIEREDRGGGGSRIGLISAAVIVVLAVAGAAWYWSANLQAASVKVASASVKTGGSSPRAPFSTRRATSSHGASRPCRRSSPAKSSTS